MEWLIIPGIIVGIALLGFCAIRIIAQYITTNDEAFFYIVWGIVLAAFLLVAMIACPAGYYSSRTDALRAEAYYQQVVLPHAISETADYVIVESFEAGIWQAGSMNLPQYNSYVRTTRYWDGVPIIGSCVYPVPEYLKYVQVSE